MPKSVARAGGKRKGKKKVIKDATIVDIFASRDKMLADAKTEDEKKDIHMACQGIFKCPKLASAAEKKACFDAVRKKLDALGGSKKKGGGKRSRSRSKGRSRSRSRSRSKGRARSRSRSR